MAEAANLSFPCVSIGMPVFNDSRFIRTALDSLLSQTYQNFELILSDDNSSDGSDVICREYAQKDARIRYHRWQANQGISRNMEYLLSEARGSYFMWAADDDCWDPNFIQVLLTTLQSDAGLVMAFSPYSFIDEENNPIIHMGVRSIDYSGNNSFIRLAKLCFYYDDGCGYALFRKKAIEGVRFPLWWWINKRAALNNIYPPLFYFLSIGKYKLVHSNPMWFNRIKENPHHRFPFSAGSVLNALASLVRKANVFYESLHSVYRARRSFLLVAAISPIVFLRFLWDCISLAIQKINKLIKRKSS